MPAAAIKVSNVIRSPPESLNNNDEYSLEQPSTYYSYGLQLLNFFLFLAVIEMRIDLHHVRRGEPWHGARGLVLRSVHMVSHQQGSHMIYRYCLKVVIPN